jgi:hypothetical protein
MSMAFEGLTKGIMKLGIRTMHKRLSIPLIDTEEMDYDTLMDLWKSEWSEHGEEYDRVTIGLMKEDKKVLTDVRMQWAGPEINKHIADMLGIGYLDYKVSMVQQREEILKSNSLIISGGIGTGKTMALAWRCKTLAMEQAVMVDYERIEDLLQVWPSGELWNRLHKGEPVGEDAAIMGIDDYGTEYVEPFALSQFELLIERRYARKHITIMTTNIAKAAFKTRKGFERIESRLLKRCAWVEFIGEDRRKPLLAGKETV